MTKTAFLFLSVVLLDLRFLTCRPAAGALLNGSAVRVVAQSGQQAPGTASGSIFRSFGQPVINNAGQTAFFADVYPEEKLDTPPQGIWSEGSGHLDLVALKNAEFFANGQMNFAFNERGETVLNGPNIWIHRRGAPELVVAPGVAVIVDGQTRTFTSVSRPVINRQGLITFAARHGNTNGIYVRVADQFHVVAENRTPVVGSEYPPPINVNVPAAINAIGRFAIFAGQNVFAGRIWTDSRGHLEPIAGFGSNTSVPFREIYSPVISTTGQVAFAAGRDLDNGSAGVDEGIWMFDENGLRPIAQEHNQAPGLPTGTVFSSLLDDRQQPLVSDDRGSFVFRAGLRDADPDAAELWSIWRYRNDVLSVIAHSQSHPPGVEPELRYTYLDRPMTNNLGQIAFSALLAGPNVYSTNDVGIWAEDVHGQLRLIAREGDHVDFSHGLGTDVRQILEILPLDGSPLPHFPGRVRGEGDQRYAFNNRGQIVFRATFRDFSQAILVSNLLVIPEPASALMAWLAVCSLVMVRLRRHPA